MTSLELAKMVFDVKNQFNKLADVCPHHCEYSADCRHPDLEFSCMGCQISQCPLLDDNEWEKK